VTPLSRVACAGIKPKWDTISWSCVKPNALALVIRRQSIHVTHGVCSWGTASNSIGIPKNAAICFHCSSGEALSKSVPRACSASSCTLSMAMASRAACGISAGVDGRGRETLPLRACRTRRSDTIDIRRHLLRRFQTALLGSWHARRMDNDSRFFLCH